MQILSREPEEQQGARTSPSFSLSGLKERESRREFDDKSANG